MDHERLHKYLHNVAGFLLLSSATDDTEQMSSQERHTVGASIDHIYLSLHMTGVDSSTSDLTVVENCDWEEFELLADPEYSVHQLREVLCRRFL